MDRQEGMSLEGEGRSPALQPETELVTTGMTVTPDPEVLVKSLWVTP